MLWFLGAGAVAWTCSDLPGQPLNASTGLSCPDFSGRCDADDLSTWEKAKLMLHCPQTCAGTVYTDGGGHAYCACVPGHGCCFDEPNDCSTRESSTVVSQVMCRKTLGLCAPQTTTAPTSRRRASACTDEVGDVSSRIRQLLAGQNDTIRLARQVVAGVGSSPPNPRLLRLAMAAFQ